MKGSQGENRAEQGKGTPFPMGKGKREERGEGEAIRSLFMGKITCSIYPEYCYYGSRAHGRIYIVQYY